MATVRNRVPGNTTDSSFLYVRGF